MKWRKEKNPLAILNNKKKMRTFTCRLLNSASCRNSFANQQKTVIEQQHPSHIWQLPDRPFMNLGGGNASLLAAIVLQNARFSIIHGAASTFAAASFDLK